MRQDYEEFRKHYSQQADDAERMYALGQDHRQSRRLEVIRQLLAQSPVEGASVLDIGSGDGYALSKVLDGVAPARVAAIDLSHDKLIRVRERVAGSLPIRGDAELLPIRAGTITAALCFETLEHLPDPQEALLGAHRALAPGGVLILSVPIDGIPQVLWDRLRARFPGADRFHEHIQLFTSRGLKRLVRETGFVLEALRYAAFALPFVDRPMLRLSYARYSAFDRFASRIPINHFGVGGHSLPFGIGVGRRYAVAVLRKI